jgi:hypothetical protein
MRPINPNFNRLFYGLAISALGNYIFDTTLILWISTRLLPGTILRGAKAGASAVVEEAPAGVTGS